MTEQIIIEFNVDSTGLQPAEDKLAALGKIDASTAQIFKQTNTELKKREQGISGVSTANTKLKASYEGLRNSVLKESQVLKLSAAEFKRTGLTLEQLAEKFKEGTRETKLNTKATIDNTKDTKANTDETLKNAFAQSNLRSRLKDLTNQLIQLKVEGQENTEQYKKLAAEAVKYKDAIGDVSKEINRSASDTRVLDGLINAASGVAGAFAVAQGATALFGDDSQELQETLVRVQGSLAILNGLQQVQNVLLKESSASLLLNKIATKAQTAAQTVFNFVVGTSTGLLKAFRIALAATGVGILIIGLVKLVEALDLFSSKSESATEAAERFAAALEEIGRNADLANAEIKREADNLKLRAEIAGKGNKELEEIDKKSLETRLLAYDNAIDKLDQQYGRERLAAKGNKEKLLKLEEEFLKKNEELVEARTQLAIDAENDALQKQIDAKKKADEDKKKADEDADRRAKERAEKLRAAELQRLEDIKTRIESELLFEREGTKNFLELQAKLAEAEKNIGLFSAKSLAEKEFALKQFLKTVDNLTTDFYANEDKKAIENQISILNAQLSNINISALEKERLTIELLERQKQLELAAVVGNKQKEKEINAKFDKEIADQSIAIREAGLNEELALLEAQQGERKRALETKAADQNADISVRIIAINDLLQIERDSIKKRSDLNDSLYLDGSRSAKDFFLINAQLIDADKRAVVDAEKAKQGAIDQTNEKRKLTNQELITAAFETTRQTLDTLATLYDFISAREQNALDTQRQRIKDLQDAGAISEKEAKERFKRLDAEERKNKQQAAQRSKAIEVFNSILAIPAAFLKGLKDGGYVLAAIYAGLAAAQAGLIAAKPIPKFSKGKKNQYQGLGEVGEAGTELIEKGGKMYVADKPQIIWLAKSDKVYNPKETIDMINRPLPKIDKRIMNISSSSSSTNIDYEKLGKAVGKNIPNVGFNFDENGFTQYIKDKNSFTTYLNNRRSF